jgi:hypothetical protein
MTNETERLNDLLSIRSRPLGPNEIEYIQSELEKNNIYVDSDGYLKDMPKGRLMRETAMTNEPPQWALDKAANVAGYHDWDAARFGALPSQTIQSIRAHAVTLTKYETELIEAVLLKARELLAAEYIKDDHSQLADDIICGAYDEDADIRAIVEALRLPEMKG